MTDREGLIIKELDEIERRAPPAEASDLIDRFASSDDQYRLYELMMAFSSSPDRLMFLIDRYGTSRASNVVGVLAGCISAKVAGAEPGFFENSWLLGVTLVRRLANHANYPSLRMTLLNALSISPGSPTADLSPLREFVWTCLTDHSKFATLIHTAAVEFISSLIHLEALDRVFYLEDYPKLIEVLETIATSDQIGRSEFQARYPKLMTVLEADATERGLCDAWLPDVEEILRYLRGRIRKTEL